MSKRTAFGAMAIMLIVGSLFGMALYHRRAPRAAVNPPADNVEQARPNATPPTSAGGEINALTPAQVKARLGQKGFYVFDNNSPEDFKEAHLPGAKWLYPFELDEKALPADKNATLVFYCYDEECTACHEGARRALKLGYKNVYIMPAGIQGWQKAGLPVET
jgi:rhodanese-related sulfurtransferase